MSIATRDAVRCLLGSLLLASASWATEPSIVARAYRSMGSNLRFEAFTTEESSALAAFDEAAAEFDRLESLMSVWREGSDVSRLNAAAGGKPVSVSQETVEALLAARRASEWTAGKFDVTFGALTGLWKFDHDQDDRIPDPEEVRKRLPLINYRDLVIDEAAKTAQLRRSGMRVHLGGIGKGYAVDRAVAILRRAGLRDFTVQAGGDLYVAGKKGKRPWRVGIRDPRGPAEQYFATVMVSDATASTSGDYERFFIHDGRRYHHILDPRTGQPASACRSVTVVAAKATIADGLSTGIFILGATEGMKLIERLDDVEGVIVDRENKIHISSGLRGKLVIRSQPTDGP